LAAELPAVLRRRRRVPPAQQRQVQHRLSREKIAQLVAEYQAGIGTNELARTYRISRYTVNQHLQRAGVPFRLRGLADEQTVEAERLYLAGWSLQRLAKRYGRDDKTIWRSLKKRGVHMRRPWERRKYFDV
jgi:hypothetical protein